MQQIHQGRISWLAYAVELTPVIPLELCFNRNEYAFLQAILSFHLSSMTNLVFFQLNENGTMCYPSQ